MYCTGKMGVDSWIRASFFWLKSASVGWIKSNELKRRKNREVDTLRAVNDKGGQRACGSFSKLRPLFGSGEGVVVPDRESRSRKASRSFLLRALRVEGGWRRDGQIESRGRFPQEWSHQGLDVVCSMHNR